MKPAKAIELAMAEIINDYADIGRNTKIRAFQNMEFNGTFVQDVDREYPFVGIGASPPMPGDDAASQTVDVAVFIQTKAVDDKAHTEISAIYEAVQGTLDRIYSGFRRFCAGGETEEYTEFCRRVKEYDTENLIANEYLSLTWADTQPPSEDNGAWVIMMTMRVHFGRTDF